MNSAIPKGIKRAFPDSRSPSPRIQAEAGRAIRRLTVVAFALICSVGFRPAFAQCTRCPTPGRFPTPMPTPTPTSPSVTCTSDTTLCLSEGRFLITATWTKPDGETGSAHAVDLTPDSGYFWFFDAANVEVAIKTLNGCGVNGHYWVFTGGLTNLKVDVAVTDTTTNTTRNYSNPQGIAFQPTADTTAFTSCSTAPRG